MAGVLMAAANSLGATGESDLAFQSSQSYQAGLKAVLSEKIQDVADARRQEEARERQAAAEYVKSDPLGLKEMNNSRQSMAGASDSRKMVRFRKKGKQESNIFRDFGKEHDPSAVQNVEIGGKVHQRVNFKRHWKSETDLRRWQQSLCDRRRNDRLLIDVVERWHPDFGTDQAELTQKHNALFRQRHDQLHEPGGRHKSSAEKLRELQHKLCPRLKHKGKKHNTVVSAFREALGDPGSSGTGGKREATKQTSAEEHIMNFLNFLMFHCSKLEEAFSFIDTNGNGRISFSEFSEALKHLQFPGDVKFLWQKLDADGNGHLSFAEWMKLEPYVLQQHLQRKMPVSSNDPSNDDLYLQATRTQVEEDVMQHRGAIVSNFMGFSDQDIYRGSRATSHAGASSSERSKESKELSLEDAGGTVGGESISTQDLVRSSMKVGDSELSETDHDATSTSPSLGSTRRRASADLSTDKDFKEAALTMGSASGELLRELNSVVQSRPESRDNKLPQMQARMPQTLSILVFRNADRSHAGEPVFIKRPSANLQDLLHRISQACRPVIGPAVCLFDTSLMPIRASLQVQHGGTYLLKGQENLDPPSQFYTHPPARSASIRHLHEAQVGSATQLGVCELPPRPSSSSASSPTCSRDKMPSCGPAPSTRVGSPPQQSPSNGMYLNDTPSISVEKWQVDDRLAMKLSYGGLGQRPRHHKFDAWAPLNARNSCSRVGSPAVSQTTGLGSTEPSVILDRPPSRSLESRSMDMADFML